MKDTTKRPGRYIIGVSGTNRGFRSNVDAITRAARGPSNNALVKTIDPEPGRAATAAAMVTARGIEAAPIVDRIENLPDEPADVIVNQTDRAGTLAEVAAMVERRRLPLLAYLIIAFRDRLLGLQIALGPDDQAARAGVRACARTLEGLTARGGSERVTGERAPVEFQLAEEGLREAFSRHAEENLSKLISGRVPTSHPVEAVWGGTREGVPAVIVQHDAPSSPSAVVSEAFSSYGSPIPWDTDVLVIDVLPEQLVFLKVRVSDGGIVTVRGSRSLDAASLAETDEMDAFTRELDARRSQSAGVDPELMTGAAMFLLGSIVRAGSSGQANPWDGLSIEVRLTTHVTPQAPVRTSD